MMIDHLGITVKDAALSLLFYDVCLAPLGIVRIQDQPQWSAAIFGVPGERTFLWIGGAGQERSQTSITGHFHLAFIAPNEAAVSAFHAAGLAAGGTDNGGPGFRRPDYFAAFVLDPDGNNIEAAWRPVQN